MSALRLELLGDLQIRSENGSLAMVSAKKAQALLAYLSVKPAQRVSREKIAALLWSSTGPDQARQSLRQTLSMRRKELTSIVGDARALIDENDLLGVEETIVSCDVADFESLAAGGNEPALVRAAELYRGDFLDGFYLNEERFDQWVIAERDRLHRMALRVYAQLVEMQARRGAVDDAVGAAQRALRIDPLQEAGARPPAQARAAHRAGRGDEGPAARDRAASLAHAGRRGGRGQQRQEDGARGRGQRAEPRADERAAEVGRLRRDRGQGRGRGPDDD